MNDRKYRFRMNYLILSIIHTKEIMLKVWYKLHLDQFFPSHNVQFLEFILYIVSSSELCWLHVAHLSIEEETKFKCWMKIFYAKFAKIKYTTVPICYRNSSETTQHNFYIWFNFVVKVDILFTFFNVVHLRAPKNIRIYQNHFCRHFSNFVVLFYWCY